VSQNHLPFTPADILGMSHVALKASRVEESLAFYRDFLGFEEQTRLNEKGTSNLMLVLVKINDHQAIEIFDGSRKSAEDDLMYQIAYVVRDAEALRAHLAAQGFRVGEKVNPGQMKNLGLIVKDPNGYNIEFVEYTEEGLTRLDAGKYLSPRRISTHMSHAGVVLRSDLAATQKFWRDTLGFEEGWRGSKDGQALSWIHLKAGSEQDTVELMLSPSTQAHFCLVVPDVEAALTELKKRPYFKKYSHPTEIRTGINKKRQLNLFDPDGIRVELMEEKTVDGNEAPSSNAPWIAGRG
jgi:lactoylglutathione lyase